MNLKYVIFGSPPTETSKETIYQSFAIFPNWIEHSIAKAGWVPVSAGFCIINQNKDFQTTATCWGESTSLKLKSNPTKDANYINRAFKDY